MRKYLLLCLLLPLACVSTGSRPENFTKINQDLYCGGSPEEDQFAYLRAQGVKSIICVDGAAPNLETAKSEGLTYLHVPVKYDKITLDQQAQLVKAFNELEKPVYIHCHHGKHRGPAASAIVLKNHYDWKNDKLIQFLQDAGTSKNYAGLYKTVQESKKFDRQKWEGLAISSSATVEPLARIMADLDRVWIKLKAQLKKPLTNEGRTIAQQRSLLLREYFVELHRMPDTRYDEEYLEIEKKIRALESALQTGSATQKALQAVAKDCKSCHLDYRN